MRIQFAARWWCSSGPAVAIGQVLQFDAPQPGFFGVEPARSEPLVAGDFVGDTGQGGSCNVNRLTLVPHCNGTHTESAAHIDPTRPGALDCAPNQPLPALLVSIEPVRGGAAADPLPESATSTDPVIDSAALDRALKAWPHACEALVVRTLPNDPGKRARNWDEVPCHVYFTPGAGQWLRAAGIRHLLVDTPSLDRADDVRLPMHRAFFDPDSPNSPASTVTELCFIPDELKDGYYLLNLQLAPFEGDAVPSRPMLMSLIADD